MSTESKFTNKLGAIPLRAPVARRPTAQYIALAALFLIAVSYQARTLEQRFPQWFGSSFVQWPFLLNADDRPQFTLTYLQRNAQNAGLQEGDSFIALNSVPVTSRGVYADALSALHPGDNIDVTFQRKGAQGQGRTRFRVTELRGNVNPWQVLLLVCLPGLCLALGFWVAVTRPRDVRAWLLLALMLSFAAFFNSFADLWKSSFRTLATIYFQFEANSWLGWLFLLGIYFPEPFQSTAKWSKCLLWIIVPLWATFALTRMLSLAIELQSLHAAIPVNRFLGTFHVERQILNALMLIIFFLCIGAKYRLALSADAKRRLRVLYAGTAVSLVPLTSLFVSSNLKGISFEQYYPEWLTVGAYLAFFLLPVTLAYVVVVQRAMDVRVVMRQGLQYTLARRGVLIVQILLSTALLISITILMTSHTVNPVGTATVLAIGLLSILLLNSAAQRVAIWVDRRFFRDAYNAEQILSDLAEKVRTIVEIKPLLETVAQRVADSLHVTHVAVLLDGGGLYRPAHALGYSVLPELAFTKNAATVQTLKSEKQPVRVYFDDTDSWIYQRSEMSDEERGQLAALQSELLLPLSARDELIGFMSLGQKLSEAPYSGTDLRLLSSVVAQTGMALEVARLTTAISSEVAQRERVNRELEIAHEVQEHLFPQVFPVIPGLDYSGMCNPARTVGGDYYDFLELPGGKFGIAVGDVSGKGIGAALMMASLVASLRGQASVVQDMPELITRVSNLVYGASSASRYATFFYAEYQPQTHQLSYVNAGHNAPFVLRGGQEVYRLDSGGGPVIGLFPNCKFESGLFVIKPGDLMVLFTDGISESMNNDDEEWGEEGLIEFAKTCDGLAAKEAMNRIMTAAQAFAAGAPQHDDMTVVVLRVLA